MPLASAGALSCSALSSAVATSSASQGVGLRQGVAIRRVGRHVGPAELDDRPCEDPGRCRPPDPFNWLRHRHDPRRNRARRARSAHSPPLPRPPLGPEMQGGVARRLQRHDLDDALASIHGPEACCATSMRQRKLLASLVSLTDGRACSPTGCFINTDLAALDSLMGRSTRHRVLRPCCAPRRGSTRRRLGRRHDRALDDRRVADHHPVAPVGRQHLDRHLAVGLGPAEIDEHRDPFSDQASAIAAMMLSTLVPRPPPGSPPQWASGTSGPTI